MRILVLNGSPHPEGNTSNMIAVFRASAENAGHDWTPTVRPPRLGGNERVGVFASRSPFRPNRLGLSLVKLEAVTEAEGRAQLESLREALRRVADPEVSQLVVDLQPALAVGIIVADYFVGKKGQGRIADPGQEPDRKTVGKEVPAPVDTEKV